ncbi:MAG: S9 family peptidase, partial [Clostridia bacterium]|nr:S9 family peptidase [Clostridia bacterium]
MDPILNRDIFDYRFISRLSLSPSGEKAAAVITNMNEKENRYESNLYLIDKEESYRLTGDDRISSYIWKDNETIIFTTVRTEEEKNEKGPNTNFYSLKLGKGEAEKLFSLPL